MDNQKVQEHIEKVREALNAVATTTGLMRYEASRFLGDHSEGWLEQSLDIIEQQQREIESLKEHIKGIHRIVLTAGFYKTTEGMNSALVSAEWACREALSPNKEVSTDVQDDR